jgi:serine/threonine-protein kinase
MTDLLDRLKAALADRYTIERELGRGGMATVYLAEDLKHRRKVAVKVLHPELAATIGADRFLREIEIAAQLNHPHILPLHDSGEADGFLYYVMPYVEGESLRERLKREKQLSLEDAVQITREVASALAHAHSLGVIHRDIKPENVLLSGGEAVVADFGIARAVTAAGGEKLTETGLAVGTPAYMSPEQASGETQLDAHSDVYSLGCVLYEMLGGEPPFTGATPQAILARKSLEAVPPLRNVRETVPVGVERAVTKALAKVPADRFPTAQQFVAALERPSPIREPAPVPWRRWLPVGVVVLVLAAGGLGLWVRGASPGGAAAGGERSMLVVLPFANLGSADDDYFADGMTDAITARLAGVAGLAVISRTSAVQYKDTDKSPQQIAEELGVDYILEGTIQRERPSDPASRVRIIPQLIDASSNTHLWAGTYDDNMSEVFRLQSNIAERVAEALQLRLLEPERRTVAAQPTESTEAYELYLRAQRYSRSKPNDNRIAEQLLERAIELDPNFALAHVLLFYVHSGASFFGVDRSPERLAKARAAVERAAELEPEAPYVQRALGYYYYEVEHDYERAEHQFLLAHRRLPNDARLLTDLAFIWRRQGRFEEAVENFKQAFVLNPRSPYLPGSIGPTLLTMGRYAEADAYLDTALSLAPDETYPYTWKARTYLLWQGDAGRAQATLERMPEGIDRRGTGLLAWATVSRVGRDYEELIARLSDSPIEEIWYQPLVYPKTLLLADAHLALGDTALARAYYDSARTRLEAEVATTPEDARLHSSLGLAYAGLERRDEAVREGRRALELMPVSRDALQGTTHRFQLAQILIRAREYEEALDQLEYLMSIPARSWVSTAMLRVDPLYDPLRELPRFQRLLAAQLSR